MQDITFHKQFIQIVDQISSWKQAIEICVEPLIKTRYVTSHYAKAVIRNMETYGNNFIVSPYVILPHARPEQGVLQNAISILIMRKSVHFDNPCKPIKLMIILAPVDSRSHLQMLRLLSIALNEEHMISNVIDSRSEEEVYQTFINSQESEKVR